MSSDGDSDDSSVYSGLEDNESTGEENDDDLEENEGGEGQSSKGDEYENDSSDEEDRRNTVGDIPLRWYDDLPHIGYDWDGQKILKPVDTDQLDEFINKMENPNYW